MPLDRAGSIDQPILERFLEKVRDGHWGHIFPEGRVWQNWRFNVEREPVLGKFKAGIGKVIAHSFPNDPVVLPIYHAGMDGIIPERILPADQRHLPSTPKSAKPQSGNHIRIYVGEPISFHEKLAAFHSKYPDDLKDWKTTLRKIELYREITAEIRQKVLELEAKAYKREKSPELSTQVLPNLAGSNVELQSV